MYAPHTKIMIIFMRWSRQNEVETQQPSCVTQVHDNEFAYSASRLHAAIRRFTLNNPIEKKKQLFWYEKNYARTQRFEQVFSNNRLKRMPCKTAFVTTHEMASCTHKKLNKWALNNYIARCHQKSTSFLRTWLCHVRHMNRLALVPVDKRAFVWHE